MENSKLKVVGVTACTTGIAHTFIAAEMLEKEAKKHKIQIKIEKQGKNIQDTLTSEEIAEADVIVIAADIEVKGLERFANKPLYQTSTKKAIKNPELLFAKIMDFEKLPIFKKENQKLTNPFDDFTSQKQKRWDLTILKNPYNKLMSGVSKMLPVVIVGGILTGLSFLIDIGISDQGIGGTRPPAKIVGVVGGYLLNNLTPMVLAGYITKSIVGDKGLVPGFIAGLVASGIFGNFNNLIPDWEVGGIDIYSGEPQMLSNILKSGFLGGIVGGFFAGFAVWFWENIFYKIQGHFAVPKELIFIPLLSSIVVILFMIGINFPLGYLMFYFKKGLTLMQQYNIAAILALILGGCMALDMGGPINKTASLVAIAHMVENGDSIYMAAVMAGGMIPPLVIAFSTIIWRSIWTDEEKNAAKVNWILGAFYITEGAIPFAAKDPKKVIPVLVFSSALGAALVALFQISISAPHGGIFVFPLLKSALFASEGLNIGLGITFYLIIILFSAALGGFLLGYLKKIFAKKLSTNLDLVPAEKLATTKMRGNKFKNDYKF